MMRFDQVIETATIDGEYIARCPGLFGTWTGKPLVAEWLGPNCHWFGYYCNTCEYCKWAHNSHSDSIHNMLQNSGEAADRWNNQVWRTRTASSPRWQPGMPVPTLRRKRIHG